MCVNCCDSILIFGYDQVILLSRGAVAFSGPPADAEAHFAAIGRPFPSLLAGGERKTADCGGGGGGNDDASGGNSDGGGGGGFFLPGDVNPADAFLDVIGDAEAMVDRGEGATTGVDGGVEGGVCGLVVMSRELLVEQVIFFCFFFFNDVFFFFVPWGD